MHKPFESYQEACRAAEAIGLEVKVWTYNTHVVLNPDGVAIAEIIGLPGGGLVFQWEDLRGK